MDTIEKTEARNYRGFTITNPGRGNWQFELNGHGDSAKTYKDAMTKIDRWFNNYDSAIATLREMGAEPRIPEDVAEYRNLRDRIMKAQDKVSASAGMNGGSLWTMWGDTTLNGELAKMDAMIEYRKLCLIEFQLLVGELKTLDPKIADKDRETSSLSYRWSEAEETVKRFAWLAN